MDKNYDLCDLKIIEKLADIVSSRELSELTVTDGGKSVVIKGKKCPPPPPPMHQMPPMDNMPAGAPPFCGGNAPAAFQPAEASSADEKICGNVVKAPIVGIYYSSPSPDKEPFVRVGDKVKKGDVIMIIESMKLMNEVQSEYEGTVKKILVENGAAVEFNQPIMIIE